MLTGLGRSPGEGHDNPLQYPCLESPIDRGDWQTTVHRVAESLSRRSLKERRLEFPLELELAPLRALQAPLAVLPVSSDKGITSLCL